MDWVCQRDFTDAVLRAHGCGLAVALSMLVKNSAGTWEPSTKDATSAARFRLGASGATMAQFKARGLTAAELFASMDAVRASDIRMDLPVQRHRGTKVRDMLARMVEVRGSLAIAVAYAVVQDAGKGYGTYRGYHWVLVIGVVGDDVVVVDPLRRQTIKWPVSLLVRAAERFGSKPWGDGRGEGVLGWPWVTWRDGHATVKAQRDAARKQRDVAVAALATSEAALEECRAQSPGDAALAKARADGIRDAAASAAATK